MAISDRLSNIRQLLPGGGQPDPQEERLKREFEGVQQTYIPMHSVLRIDQVEKQGVAKISTVEGKVTSFPGPVYTPKSVD